MKETTKNNVESLSRWFDRSLAPALKKFANQRHLVAIRNGIVCTIPFVIIGSLAGLILNFPIGNVDGSQYLKEVMPTAIADFLFAINAFSIGAMGLYAAFGIAAYIGKNYGFNSILMGMMGVFAYLLWFDYGNATMSLFGGTTIFNSMVSGLLAVELYRFCVRFHLIIKMPKQVPGSISDSFGVIVPILLVSLIFGGSRYLIGFDFNSFLTVTMAPLSNFFTSGFGGVLMILVSVHFFWAFGIHGSNVLFPIISPFWEKAITTNNALWVEGINGSDLLNHPDYAKFPEMFLQWTVYIGGCGATLGLNIAGLIFAKSAQGKAISRASIVPGIFNINEPTIFGYPVMLNPILLIPFFIIPLVLAPISQLLVIILGIHWVAIAPWTLPAPIGALFASGMQWQVMIIPVISIIISTLIYIPFLIKWDKGVLAEEQATAEKLNEIENRTAAKHH